MAACGVPFLAASGLAREGGSAASGRLTDLIPGEWLLAPAGAMLGLISAWVFFRQIMRVEEGTEIMRRIAQYVRDGANAYLRRQYRVIIVVFAVLAAVFALLAAQGMMRPLMPVTFVAGGFVSGLCGWIGMRAATHASARTANMARRSLNGGLRVAFRSGAVMGLTVVGFGLLNISLWYLLLIVIYVNHLFGLGRGLETAEMLREVTATMLTFGMGASTMALFARVGGGIYTKAADVGADLVGKVEAGIPEDDPRNPATIADNVGDNVGDVAGMGADLYESY